LLFLSIDMIRKYTVWRVI